MNSTREVLAARLTALKSKHNNSIESSASNNTNSIEIPAEVDALIDNKAYYPKFRKLLREYRREIMALVELAHTKAQPSRWFATVTAKANWSRTLKFLAELFRVRETAERAAKKLGTAVSRFIYRQVWRGVNVERWAVTAAEAGRHKAKYFTWLCQREASLAGPARIPLTENAL
jgi:hypothetical protein